MANHPERPTQRSQIEKGRVQALSKATQEWLHRFRSMNGEPYVFALVSDDAALSVRPAANTEANFRAAVQEAEPGEVERCRWNRDAWVSVPSGPSFDLFSAVLKNGAWQPDFTTFRDAVLEAMVLALADTARRGVFGKRDHPGAMTLFVSIDHAADASTVELSSAARLNSHREAQAFAAYRGRSNPAG